MKTPTLLFHGGKSKLPNLKPGFEVTGKEVTWDKTESNRFLYASVDKNEAIGNAIASALDAAGLTEFHGHNDFKDITFVFEDMDHGSGVERSLETIEDVCKFLDRFPRSVYLIPTNLNEGRWQKVNNAYNNSTTEYKTSSTIGHWEFTEEKVDVRNWLNSRNVKIKNI